MRFAGANILGALILNGFGDLVLLLCLSEGSSPTRGFELPGAHRRKRIKELQAKIHHLDKAHHYFELGDIYFQQGKLDKAEAATALRLNANHRTLTPARILANACCAKKGPPRRGRCSKAFAPKIQARLRVFHDGPG